MKKESLRLSKLVAERELEESKAFPMMKIVDGKKLDDERFKQQREDVEVYVNSMETADLMKKDEPLLL